MLRIKSRLNIEHITLDLFFIHTFKSLYQKIFLFTRPQQCILMVIGCQRSGTSLINRVFARDLNACVYRESSRLSSKDNTHTGKYKLRLNSFADLEKSFDRNKTPIVVCKPLVETQNILDLFSYFPESKALWMYRNYKDVTNSLLNKFNKNVGIRNIRAIVHNDRESWCSEKVPELAQATLSKYFSEDMRPVDAAALFWFARNLLFFELKLDRNPRVLMCRYEDLASQPNNIMQNIYEFLGAKFSNNHSWEVNTNSIQKGNSIELLPEIDKLCNDLLIKLDNAYSYQSKSYSKTEKLKLDSVSP